MKLLRSVDKPLVRIVIWPTLITLISWALNEKWPHLGVGIHPGFYEVVAQIIPVLLLAHFVEERGFVRELSAETDRVTRVAQGEDELVDGPYAELRVLGHEIRTSSRYLVAGMAIVGALGMGLALFALAKGQTSTFLVAGSSLSVSYVFVRLVAVGLKRFDSSLGL